MPINNRDRFLAAAVVDENDEEVPLLDKDSIDRRSLGTTRVFPVIEASILRSHMRGGANIRKTPARQLLADGCWGG